MRIKQLIVFCCLIIAMFFQSLISVGQKIELKIVDQPLQYFVPSEIKMNAIVTDMLVPDPDHLRIKNIGASYPKLFIYYTTPTVFKDVIQGGNNALEIMLRDNSTGINWNNVEIQFGSSIVKLQSYIDKVGNVINEWKIIRIPLSDFGVGFDFTKVNYIIFPKVTNVANLDISVGSIVFTGGISPFVWFGYNKTDNTHDGDGDVVKYHLSATLVKSSISGEYAKKAELFINDTLITSDEAAPFNFSYKATYAGTFNLKGKLTSSTGRVFYTPILPIVVKTPPIPPSRIRIDFTPKALNQSYIAPSRFTFNAIVSNESEPCADYLRVVKDKIGYLKLNFGYKPNNLFYGYQNVINDGNDSLVMIIKDFAGNCDWSKIQIRPSSLGTVALLPYIIAAKPVKDGWIRVAIPLKIFPTNINFSALSFIQFPYGNDDKLNFEIGIQQILFTGKTPFQWFGNTKFDNPHDGDNGSLQLFAELVNGINASAKTVSIDFYNGSTLISTDRIAPYSVFYKDLPAGIHRLSAKLTDTKGLIKQSDTIEVLVDEPKLDNAIVIDLTFKNSISWVDIQKAVLKYNKKFAFSFTFDDGYKDAYTHAYPLFMGGVDAENRQYPGLFYTDGCGNKVNFKGSVAWNSLSKSGADIRSVTPNYITWNDLKEMVKGGWSVINHSLSHSTMLPTTAQYINEISENRRLIKEKSDFDAVHFAIPSGDGVYTTPAFANGMVAIYGEDGSMPGTQNGLKVDAPLNYNNFRLYRKFIKEDFYKTDITTVMQSIDEVNTLSNNGDHIWYNQFTHNVNSPLNDGSLGFGTFKYYMQTIESKYGAAVGGSDVIWMAPLQDVYEYLYTRDTRVVKTSVADRTVRIVIDTQNLPAHINRPALSLIINGNSDIINVTSNSAIKFSWKGTGTNKLLNIEWGSRAFNSIKETQDFQKNEALSIVLANQNQLKFAVKATSGIISAQVFDLSGRTLVSEKVSKNSENQYALDIRKLKSGAYILSATLENGIVASSKFVK